MKKKFYIEISSILNFSKNLHLSTDSFIFPFQYQLRLRFENKNFFLYYVWVMLFLQQQPPNFIHRVLTKNTFRPIVHEIGQLTPSVFKTQQKLTQLLQLTSKSKASADL